MKNKGFTLLFSVLISSVVLSVSLGIYTIISKELIISTVGRESQVAFYAADTGIECALYWDLREGAFDSPIYTINCLDQIISEPTVASSTTFQLTGFSNGSCAEVTVDSSDPGGQIVIDSLGWNTCDTNVRFKTERALRVTYFK